MATTSTAAVAEAAPAQLQQLKTKLYDSCWEDDPRGTLTSADLISHGIVPGDDMKLLTDVLNSLLLDRLFKIVHHDGQVCYQMRSVTDATKYRGLSKEQTLVYTIIDDAGREGIWTKSIKNKTNLHDATLKTIFKDLEKKNLIQEFKNVQNPTRKMYIKSGIQASEAATGGPFFADNELDEEFILQISDALHKYIESKSWYKSKSHRVAKKPPRPKMSAAYKKSVADVQALRDAAFEPRIKVELEDDEQGLSEVSAARAAHQANLDALLPYPAGYKDYPHLSEMTRWILDKNISPGVVLSEPEIQQLLDILVWDNKIEPMSAGAHGTTYRSKRRTADEIEDGPTNGFTQAPCSRCPVFDLCEEGGPVAPSNCVYYERWLNFED